MTKEDQELLLKDLCARLPYGVKVQVYGDDQFYGPAILAKIDVKRKVVVFNFDVPVEDVKPYLRPMSSMTEEELKMFKQLQVEADEAGTFEGDMLLYDWLNKNHFDYRLLIFQGLALEAPEGMYKV